MRNFDTEIASLRAIGTVFAAAQALVMSIPDRMEAAVEAFKANNPEVDTAPLDDEIAGLRANADALAAAVVANTSHAGTDGAAIPPGSGGESKPPAPATDAPQPPLTEADQNAG